MCAAGRSEGGRGFGDGPELAGAAVPGVVDPVVVPEPEAEPPGSARVGMERRVIGAGGDLVTAPAPPFHTTVPRTPSDAAVVVGVAARDRVVTDGEPVRVTVIAGGTCGGCFCVDCCCDADG